MEETENLSPDLFVGAVTVQQHAQFDLVLTFGSGSSFILEL